MPSNHRKVRMIATLALAVLATSLLVPIVQAGPIGDMLARRRQAQQLKLPPVDKPFSTKPVQDLNVRTASLKDRFKKRFAFKKNNSTGGIPLNPDLGVTRASR